MLAKVLDAVGNELYIFFISLFCYETPILFLCGVFLSSVLYLLVPNRPNCILYTYWLVTINSDLRQVKFSQV